MQDNSPEMCPEPSCILETHAGQHMTADEQEARSIGYVHALRIVRLSSGRWAVSKMLRGQEPCVCETLDPEMLTRMLAEQEREDSTFRESVATRRVRKETVGQAESGARADQALKDLGFL